MSTETLEDIRDGSQSHPNVNQREARYKIRDLMNKIQSECKGELKSTRNTVKGLHNVFKTVLKESFARIYTFGRIWFRSFPFHSKI